MAMGLSYPLAGSSLRPTMPKHDFVSTATLYIVQPLEGSRKVFHLSGSHFLTSGCFQLGCCQTESESLVPYLWFFPF